MKQVQLKEHHLQIVQGILKKWNIRAHVFGSRSKGTAKDLSDLDLCLKDPCDKSTLRKLADDFEESNLPFKVDIVVWDQLDSHFQQHIQKDLMLLPL